MDIWELIIIIIIRLLVSFIVMGWDCSGPYFRKLKTDTSKTSYQISAGTWH